MYRVNKRKLADVIHYIIANCANKENFGKTLLYKMLYFSDFDYYELYEEPLTGEQYRKIDYGPAPCHFKDAIKLLEKENKIKKITVAFKGCKQEKYLPLKEPEVNLTKKELEVIDSVIGRLSNMSANQVSAFSHNDLPFKATKYKEIIDYELVFYRGPVFSVRGNDNSKNKKAT